MKITKEEGMKRGEFLRSLGLSTSTLMAFYCLGTTMTACGTDQDDPDPTPGGGSGLTGTTTGSNINFTVDLTHNTYSKLKSAGGSMIIGEVLVANSSKSGFVALSKICTHEGNEVQFRSGLNDVYCPTHLSEFTLTGAVTQGPAVTALKAYKTAVSADGNTLTVTA